MGKKSKLKRRKQSQEYQNVIVSQKASHHGHHQNALEWFLVHLVRFGVYLSLFTPLVVSQAFYFPFVAPKSLFFIGLAEIVIAGWVALMIIDKKYRPSFKLTSISLLVFLGVVTLTSLLGVSFANSFWSKFERMTGILMLMHLVAFFLVITSVFKTKKDWQKIFAFSICAALIVGAVAFTTNFIDKTGELTGEEDGIKYTVSYFDIRVSKNADIEENVEVDMAKADKGFIKNRILDYDTAMDEIQQERNRAAQEGKEAKNPLYSFVVFISNSYFLKTYFLFGFIFSVVLLFLKRQKYLSLGMVGSLALVLLKPDFLLYYSVLLFIALLTLSIVKRWKNLAVLMVALPIVFLLISFLSTMSSSRGGSTIGNTSFLGTYLLFNIFFALYLFFSTQLGKSRKKYSLTVKAMYLLTAIVLFLPVVLGNAKAATLSVLGGISLLFLLYLAFGIQQKQIRTAGKGLLIVAVAVFLVSSLLIFKNDSIIRERFIEEATKSRLVVWQTAWQGFKEKPLTGWGAENFEFVFSKHYNPCMFLSECGGEIWFDRAHNIIFDTLVTSGILGLLSYITIFVVSLFVLWKAFFKKSIGFWEASVPTAILVAYSVQNLTVFDMVSSYLMFFLTLGFVALTWVEQKESEPVKIISVPFGKSVLIAIVALIFVVVFFEFVVEPVRSGTSVIEALKTRDEDVSIHWHPQVSAMRLAFYETALTASPMSIYQTREFLAGNSQSRATRVSRGDLDEGRVDGELVKAELNLIVEGLEKTMQDIPMDYRTGLRLAQTFYLFTFFDGNYAPLAEEWARKIINISPTNQQGYIALAQIMVAKEDFEEAISLAQTAVDLENRIENFHRVLIQVLDMAISYYQATENNEKVEEMEIRKQEALEKALEINPDWQNIF